MHERLNYRVQKRLFQHLAIWNESDQLTRLRAADWDILIVLDACRSDSLRASAGWPIDTAVSPASCTPQWLQSAASRGIFESTHIISGNPQYEKIESAAETVNIDRCWETDWDEQCQTVLPEPILDS
jgi:hypothetical protein